MSVDIKIAHHKGYNSNKKFKGSVDNSNTLCPFFDVDVVFRHKLSIDENELSSIFEDIRMKVFLDSGGKYMMKPFISENGFTLYIFVNTEIYSVKTYQDKLDALKKYSVFECLKDIDIALKPYYVKGENITDGKQKETDNAPDSGKQNVRGLRDSKKSNKNRNSKHGNKVRRRV